MLPRNNTFQIKFYFQIEKIELKGVIFGAKLQELLGGQGLLRCDRRQIPPQPSTFTTLEGYSHVQTYTNLRGFVEVVWSHGELCLVVASRPLSC